MAEAQTFQVTPKKQLLALLKEVDLKKDKAQSVAGEIGQRVKEAVENGRLNRGAFGLVVKLYRMEEDKRADFLRSFDAYRTFCTEENLFGEEHVGDLLDSIQSGEVRIDFHDEPSAQDAAEADQRAIDEHNARNAEAILKGIKPLDQGEPERLAAVFERGRIAFLDGVGAVIPDDLTGKVGEEWLNGWRSVQLMAADERDALRAQRETAAGEPFEDDATAKKPSRRGRRPALGEGADAPGSYAVSTH